MFLTRDNTKGKKLREGRRGRREDEKSTREGHDEEEETREDKREREELGSGLGEGVGDHAGGGVARCAAGYIADPGSCERGRGGQRIILRAWSVKSRGWFMVEP